MVPRLRSLVAPAAVALALAAPGAAFAQGAGDDQYADPFGSNDQGQQQGSSGGGSGSSGSSGSTGSHSGSSGSSGTTNSGSSGGTSGAPATSAPVTSSSSSSSSSSSATTAQAAPAATATAAGAATRAQLPYTGANAGLIALAGALLLGGGVALRVRLRDEPRHD